MTHRNKDPAPVLRQAYAALQAGRFAEARDISASVRTHAAGGVIHALAAAAAGDLAQAPALAAIARANPGARHPVHDLVDLLRRHGRAGEAPAHIEAALRHGPDDAALLALLGAARAESGPLPAAIEAFRQVTTMRPDDAAAWSNLGKALAASARFAEAEPAFAHAARLAPGDAQLALNHGVARLKSGRLADGWPLFRRRHALPGRAPPAAGPELTALDQVAGRTVLLLHDEGYGDSIQFIRYVPLLVARGARVLAQVPPPLARLFAGMPGLEAATAARPDAWVRIPDLPALFGTTLDTIPAALPYLSPDAALAAAWARRLPPGRRVGVVWAGGARAHDPAAVATDRIRSIPADRLGPLLRTPGITWISLQQGHPAPPGVYDPMPGVTDFADTLAIIAGLEAVVSVDTAVAHLAAAAGRPVILLDRHDSCWRWLTGRVDSPWYPAVLRIVRQPAPGDWDSVLQEASRLLVDGEFAR